jgi:hypothetical protein
LILLNRPEKPPKVDGQITPRAQINTKESEKTITEFGDFNPDG